MAQQGWCLALGAIELLKKKPRLLLLDEPTAALDEANRKRALTAIKTLLENSTVVLVTHDLSLIKPMSPVLFLAAPAVAHCGRHEEMLLQNSEYASFVKGLGMEDTVEGERVDGL